MARPGELLLAVEEVREVDRRLGVVSRLGVPNYAGDVMTMRGEVTAVDGNLVTVAVRGSNSLGDHVIGTVTAEVPA